VSTPRYYRGVPEWIWVVLVVGAGLLGLYFAGRRALEAAEDRGRQAAYADATSAANLVWPAERARWNRERDSLAARTAQIDTVLVTRLRTVRELVTDTLRDTLVARDTVLVRACSALADDCAAFRVSATAALLLADSTRRADSLAAVALIVGRIAATDSLRTTRRALDRAPTWRTTVLAVLAFSGAAYITGSLIR